MFMAETSGWTNEWSFQQSIDVDIDTSLNQARFQPVDLTIGFDNVCWAKDEQNHSIRVGCLHNSIWYELESQIYNLTVSSADQISQCNIVFLIPEFADGSETYAVFYNDDMTIGPAYADHVSIEESYYYYEPIPGYPLESSYYEVIDEGFINYMISYDGQFMGYNTCQHVYKMLDGTTKILPKNAEIFAAFDYKYCYEDGLFGYSSTSQKLVSKEVITDGNLMIQIGIESISKFDDLRTTARYTYYHCPSEDTRLHAHIIHETLEDIDVYDMAKTDGAFASMQAGGVKSNSIQELNIGKIFPWMHFTNELGQISTYELDTNPEYIAEDPDIRVISVHDDVDLGFNPFVSFDDGSSGTVHALVFSTNEVAVSDSDQTDGLQINAFQMDYPHLAGFENNVATVQIGRNSVEPGQNHDTLIPQGFTVEFDTEFYSSSIKGYDILQEESGIFKDLVAMKPDISTTFKNESNKYESVNLSVFVHHVLSFPMGSSLSAAFGWNFSYVSVDLYDEDEFLYSKNAVRIPLNALEEDDNPSLLDKIRVTIGLFDFRNSSLLKKAVFSGVRPGNYIIKAFLENPLIPKNRQFIGFSVVTLNDDATYHIWCRKQASVEVQVQNQHHIGIPNMDIILKRDDQIISSSMTDENGFSLIHVPVDDEPYQLVIEHDGMEVYREPLKLSIYNRLFQAHENVTLHLVDLVVKVTDTWQQTPAINLNPVLSVEDSGGPLITIFPDDITDAGYVFRNLSVQNYKLSLRFKSFVVEETINVDKDKEIHIPFPAEFPVLLNIMDSRGHDLTDTHLSISRGEVIKRFDIKHSDVTIFLPPGEYQLKMFSDDTCIGYRTLSVSGEKTVDMVTGHEPLYPLIVLVILSIMLFIMILRWVFLHKKNFLIITIMILLFTASFVFPWWEISGFDKGIETTTQLFVLPQIMITLYQTDQSLTGEISFLPDEFNLAMTMILVITITAILLLLILEFLAQRTMVKKKIHLILSLVLFLAFVIVLSLFLFAIGQVSSFSVGGIFGSDMLDIGVPGENTIYTIHCEWGLGNGFYLYLIGVLLFMGHMIYKPMKRWQGNDC